MKLPELVSVIIPAYNSLRFLEEALRSVVQQSYRPLEIILVDDGSTDGTEAWVGEIAEVCPISIRYFYQDNQGPAVARNRGIELATGQYIAFLDADDLWPADKVTQQMTYLTALHTRLDVVIGHVEVRAWHGKSPDVQKWTVQRRRWLSPLLGATLCHRSVFDRVGGFAPEMRYGEDVDWLLRVRESDLHIRIVDEVTLIYRLHDMNLVQNRGEMDHFSLMALRKSLQRRRGQESKSELPPIQNLSISQLPATISEMKPGVTVILPVYNGAHFLDQALESVMAQSYPSLQVIVVDDGSTDDTAQVASHWPDILYLYQPNQGNGAAKNLGLSRATQPLVAFLDVDDRWLPTKLAEQVAHLQLHPDLGYVLCHMQAELESGLEWPAHLNQAHYGSNPPLFAPSALLAWRKVFNHVGLFSVKYRTSNDSDWFLRANDAEIPMAVLPKILVHKGIHADNLTHSVEPLTRELFHALRASVRRQRPINPF